MNYESFKYTSEEGVGHLILDKGEDLNKMTMNFWYELPRILDEIAGKYNPNFLDDIQKPLIPIAPFLGFWTLTDLILVRVASVADRNL